jgi:uncharacterized membrane protein YjjP (DUF1212 family)
MNHALSPAPLVLRTAIASSASVDQEARLKRLRSLLGLFALYAVALVAVMFLSDGADIGCILAAIAGHVLYATVRIATSWRDASWLEQARERIAVRAPA